MEGSLSLTMLYDSPMNGIATVMLFLAGYETARDHFYFAAISLPA